MSWTIDWRLLAKKGERYDVWDYEGPACYELSIAGPKGGGRKIPYIGHTSNTKERLTSHARGDTDLAEIIDSHLNDGWLLDFRVWVFDTKEEAQETERRLFERNNDPDKYGWNAIHP